MTLSKRDNYPRKPEAISQLSNEREPLCTCCARSRSRALLLEHVRADGRFQRSPSSILLEDGRKKSSALLSISRCERAAPERAHTKVGLRSSSNIRERILDITSSVILEGFFFSTWSRGLNDVRRRRRHGAVKADLDLRAEAEEEPFASSASALVESSPLLKREGGSRSPIKNPVVVGVPEMTEED